MVNLWNTLQKLCHLFFSAVEVNLVSVQAIAELCKHPCQCFPINLGTTSYSMISDGNIVDDEKQPMWILVQPVWRKVLRNVLPAMRKEGLDLWNDSTGLGWIPNTRWQLQGCGGCLGTVWWRCHPCYLYISWRLLGTCLNVKCIRGEEERKSEKQLLI